MYKFQFVILVVLLSVITSAYAGCNGDPNARKGCDKFCQTCDNPQAICTADCPNPCGCDCKQGYLYNTRTGKCVLPRNCPPTCGCNGDPNAQKGCDKFCQTCDNPQAICTADCPNPTSGCDCKPGYLYNTSTGKCVLPENCPVN